MHIFFMGQKGIPAHRTSIQTDECRVEQLSHALSEQGHQVEVACSKPYSPKNISVLGNTQLVHLPAFNPEKSGGFLHLLFCLWHVWRTTPGVVHIHGWKAASLLCFAALFSPETTYIWTISSLPSSVLAGKLILWQAKLVCDAIATPARSLQYQLLVGYNTKIRHIPDGYATPALPDISATRFGLRKNQYVAALVSDTTDIRWILKAYNTAKIRKKLVIFGDKTPATKRLEKKHPFLVVVPALQGRAKTSIIRQAGVVILAHPEESPETTLQAMDAERTIIATTASQNEETLGTTAHFIKHGDSKALGELLKRVSRKSAASIELTKNARKRAQTHFTFSRALEDYISLYHYPMVRRIPVDSIVSKQQFA